MAPGLGMREPVPARLDSRTTGLRVPAQALARVGQGMSEVR